MSTDFEQKEFEFLAHLKADTGRDLEEWMMAISAQNLPHRNDIIDWLRQQNFIFARASWLERIHHNGGQPIYLDAIPAPIELGGSTVSAPEPVPEPAPTPRRFASIFSAGQPANDTQPAPNPTHPAAPLQSNDLRTLIARAKAYAPLANYIVAQITGAAPGTVASARTGHIDMSNPGTFAVVAITAKQLLLGLDLDPLDTPYDGGWQPPRFPATAVGVPDNISHMTELNDARQIDDQLLALVRTSHRRRNS